MQLVQMSSLKAEGIDNPRGSPIMSPVRRYYEVKKSEGGSVIRSLREKTLPGLNVIADSARYNTEDKIVSLFHELRNYVAEGSTKHPSGFDAIPVTWYCFPQDEAEEFNLRKIANLVSGKFFREQESASSTKCPYFEFNITFIPIQRENQEAVVQRLFLTTLFKPGTYYFCSGPSDDVCLLGGFLYALQERMEVPTDWQERTLDNMRCSLLSSEDFQGHFLHSFLQYRFLINGGEVPQITLTQKNFCVIYLPKRVMQNTLDVLEEMKAIDAFFFLAQIPFAILDEIIRIESYQVTAIAPLTFRYLQDMAKCWSMLAGMSSQLSERRRNFVQMIQGSQNPLCIVMRTLTSEAVVIKCLEELEKARRDVEKTPPGYCQWMRQIKVVEREIGNRPKGGRKLSGSSSVGGRKVDRRVSVEKTTTVESFNPTPQLVTDLSRNCWSWHFTFLFDGESIYFQPLNRDEESQEIEKEQQVRERIMDILAQLATLLKVGSYYIPREIQEGLFCQTGHLCASAPTFFFQSFSDLSSPPQLKQLFSEIEISRGEIKEREEQCIIAETKAHFALQFCSDKNHTVGQAELIYTQRFSMVRGSGWQTEVSVKGFSYTFDEESLGGWCSEMVSRTNGRKASITKNF